MKYKGVADWVTYLQKLANQSSPIKDQVYQLAENKASRDILVHHSGIVNEVHMQKEEILARNEKGDRLNIPEQYLRHCLEVVLNAVQEKALS